MDLKISIIHAARWYITSEVPAQGGATSSSCSGQCCLHFWHWDRQADVLATGVLVELFACMLVLFQGSMSKSIAFSLQGHTKEVHCVCWDANGDFLASVSHDSVRVWSLASEGENIHELNSNGNEFLCCVFHPSYPNLLVVGGYQVIYIRLQFLWWWWWIW